MKLTAEQVQGRKDKAVRFLDDVLGDPTRSAEVEDESLESYAARRGFEIVNPRRNTMTLREQVDALESVIETATEILTEAYEPESSREELAKACGEALDALLPDDDDDEDEGDDGDESE